jgi:hypothetical protein
MISTRIACFVILFFLSPTILHAQIPTCQTGPMEGYRGEKCQIMRITSANGFVYTYSRDTKAIKKWNFATGQIVQEWPIEREIEFRSVSHDGRYIEIITQIKESFWSSQLFDTQTGKLVPIENMGVFAILPNNIAVVRDEKRKVMLYDMKSNKIKATLGKDHGKFLDVSDNGNIIAWSNYEGFSVNVYDVSKGDVIFKQEVNRRDMPLSVSPDGRFVVWCGGIKDLKTNKTMPLECQINNLMEHQILYLPDGKTAYSILTGENKDFGTTLVIVYVREYNLETGAMIAEYRDPFVNNARFPYFPGGIKGALAHDGQHLYFPSKTGMVLVDKTSYLKQEKSLDFFGNIGAAGLAQEQQKERRLDHLAQLNAAAKKSFENVTASGAAFQFDIKVSLFDYDPISELAVVGNIYEAGLLNVKDGKFIATYSNTVNRPGLSVKTNHQYADYSVAPGGELVAVTSNGSTSLYNKSAFKKDIKDVAVRKLINQRFALVQSKSDMLGLYDLNSGDMIVTYRKWNDQLQYSLSPDRSKILFRSNGKAEVVDVLTGKVLRRLEGTPTWITNKYIVTNPVTAELIDIASGERVIAKGWDVNRSGREYFVEGNYLCYINQGVIDAYDLDKLAYVNDMPVPLIGSLTFNYVAAFPGSQKLLVCTSSGSATFFFTGKEKEFASAYTVNLNSGEFNPFRFHISTAESHKLYSERQAQYDQQQAARAAQENAGLDPCMHNLKIKPNRVVVDKSGNYYRVVNYDCQNQNYQVTSGAFANTSGQSYNSSVPKWQMDTEYNIARVSVCSKCNGSGMHTHTVNYSTTDVDNYNANAPGAKVITTKSGSFEKTETCPVCKGSGAVPAQ